MIGLLIIAVTFVVLYLSIPFFSDSKNNIKDNIKDVTRSIIINDVTVKVKYIGGNLIDESITFGNILNKEIVLTNSNDEPVTYSITFKEVSINNDKVTYSLKISEDGENYTYISKNTPVTSDMHIGYNLVIEAKTKLNILIEFKSLFEGEATNIKGALNVEDNLSERDLFTNNIKLIQSQVVEKINEKKGITIPNYYLLNINELGNQKIKGYVVIDANDISDIKYIYYAYNNNLMLKNYVYTQEFSKNDIYKKDKEISTLNDQTLCALLTKNTCPKFSTLKVNTLGTEQEFHDQVKDIISKAELLYKPISNTQIYEIQKDIDKTSKLRGYILINNVGVEKPEYYLYITNNVFIFFLIMVYIHTKNCVK